jgi:hypothetical protein
LLGMMPHGVFVPGQPMYFMAPVQFGGGPQFIGSGGPQFFGGGGPQFLRRVWNGGLRRMSLLRS